MRCWDWDGNKECCGGFNFGGINDDKSLGFLIIFYWGGRKSTFGKRNRQNDDC